MARRAFFRGRLIEQHRFAAHRLQVLVASLAAHILMSSLQRKRRPALVVEERRLPFQAVVAFGARRDLAAIGELRAMDVLMAFLAFARRCLEVGLHQPGAQIRRLMAINAGCPTMCSQQRERRLGMIERAQVMPRFGIVASLTAQRRS